MRKEGIEFYPDVPVGAFKMGKTFAFLGEKPVIDLHTAGLKVGEIMKKCLSKTDSTEEAKKKALKEPLCLDLPEQQQTF